MERNRTLRTEWAYREIFLDNDIRTAAPAPWMVTRPQPRSVTNLMTRYI